MCRGWYYFHMQSHGDAGTANSDDNNTHGGAMSSSSFAGNTPSLANDGARITARGTASDANSTTPIALDDHREYTLTAGQAIEFFEKLGRIPPSLRTLQRWCAHEVQLIKAVKIKTSYGTTHGQVPSQPWWTFVERRSPAAGR